MMPLLFSGILACTGGTDGFNVKAEVDYTNQSVNAELIDLSGNYDSMIFRFTQLKKNDNCLENDKVKFCGTPNGQNSSLTFEIEQLDGMYWFVGSVSCKQK
jgi:hypothetical protein